MFARIVLLARLLLVVGMASAQDDSAEQGPPLLQEAPETLLELQIGDAEVDLFGAGNWVSGIGGSLGAAVTWGSGVSIWQFPYSVPGLDAVPFFNSVDMTLSLWLLNRYFVETSVSDELQISDILFGYQGGPDEFVQTVLVGNTGIDMTEYSYLGFGDSVGAIGRDAPGAVAAFQTPLSDHEIMVRFEPSSESELVYANGGIVDEVVIPASDYLRHRQFVLPDSNLSQLSIYQEDPNGTFSGDDGRSYRLVDLANETVFSLIDGIVLFDAPPTGRLVAYYTVGATTIGDAGLGVSSFYLLADGSPDEAQPADLDFDAHPVADPDLTDFINTISTPSYTIGQSELVVTVGPHQGLVIYDPGRYSPLESAGVYAIPPGFGGSEVRFALARHDFTRITAPVAIAQSGDVLMVGDPGDPRSYSSRYPFASPGLPDPNNEIYGPVPQASLSEAASRADYMILAQRTTQTDRILLPANYVPGSVRVIRNGLATGAYSVADDGEITFTRPLTQTDAVRVLFRTTSGAESGDLILGAGNRINVTDSVTVEAAAGVRWKPIAAEYTTVPGSHPGYFAASSSVTYDGGQTANAYMDIGASYAIPDTTGVLRIAGMDGKGTNLAISPSRLFPAPEPEGPLWAGLNDRGRLFYVDYATVDFLGNEQLLPYNAVVDQGNVYAYEEGGRIGPYPALSADAGAGDFTGTAMVMEYELDALGDWVGGILTIPGSMDLSGTQGITFSYKAIDIAGDVDVHLQLGAIDEDLDGDGTLDAGLSAVSPYLQFDDSGAGISLLAGTVGQLRTSLSEDGDGDGLLDAELPDRVFTYPSGPSPPIAVTADTGWTEVSIDLNASDRLLLTEARSVRVIIERTAVGPASGKILISSLELHGTEFSVRSPDTVDVSAIERDEMLELDWSESAADSFALVRHTDPIAARDYGEMQLTYQVESPSGRTMTLRATDGVSGNTVAEASVALPPGGWEVLSVPLPASTAVITRFEIEFSGSGDGRVILDELSLNDPQSRFGMVADAGVTWRPALTIDLGEVSVIRDVSLEQRVTARGDGHADGLTAITPGVTSTTQGSANVLGALTSGSFTVSGEAGVPGTIGYLGSHELRLPFLDGRLTLAELYRQSFGSLGGDNAHELSLSAVPGTWGRTALGWEVTNGERDVFRKWRGEIALTTGEVTAGEDDTGGSDTGEGATAVRVNADLSVAASERLDPETGSEAYFTEWATSFAHINPGYASGGSQSRDLNAAATLSLNTASFGVEASLAGSVDTTSETDLLTSNVEARIRVPISFQNGVSFSAEAGRTLTLTDTIPGAGFLDDLGSAGSLIAGQRLLYGAIPLWELFDPSLAAVFSLDTEELDSAHYGPDISLAMTRPISSDPWSLLIPTAASLSFSRRADRNADALRGETTFATRASFIAPNLFGRLGVLPVFDFYDSDEFISAALLSLTVGEGGMPVAVDGQLDLQQRYFWINQAKLDVDASIHATVEQTVTEGYRTAIQLTTNGDVVWESRLHELPFLTEMLPADTQLDLEHTETINIVTDATAIGNPTATWSLTVVGRHTTELIIPDTGSIRVYAGLGAGGSRGQSSSSFYFGASFGIEGQISL